MKTDYRKKLSSFILCTALIVAMALPASGCGSKPDSGKPPASGPETETTADSADTQADGSGQQDSSSNSDEGTPNEDSSTKTDEGTPNEDSSTASDGNMPEDGSVLGEGSLQFPFTVTDPDGNETSFEIHTEKETVGEALSELGLIEGEDSEYGLFVQTVCGITLDYDKDGLYWAFYINEEYASSGVDSTAITEGDSYHLKAEKS